MWACIRLSIVLKLAITWLCISSHFLALTWESAALVWPPGVTYWTFNGSNVFSVYSFAKGLAILHNSYLFFNIMIGSEVYVCVCVCVCGCVCVCVSVTENQSITSTCTWTHTQTQCMHSIQVQILNLTLLDLSSILPQLDDSSASIVHSFMKESLINIVWKSIICNMLLSKRTSSDMPMQHSNADVKFSVCPWNNRFSMVKQTNVNCWNMQHKTVIDCVTSSCLQSCTYEHTDAISTNKKQQMHWSNYQNNSNTNRHNNSQPRVCAHTHVSLPYLLQQPPCQGSHDLGLDPCGPCRHCAWLLWPAC